MNRSLLLLLFLGVGEDKGGPAEPPASPTPEQVRRTLDEVFSRSEFKPTSPWFDWQRLLAQFFDWLGSLSGTAPLLFWCLLLGCLALLVLLLAHLGRLVYSVLSASRRARGDRDSQQRRQLSGSFAAAADHSAAAGDFTEAVRCLFLCLVFHFDESGRISFLPSGTNREYLGQFTDRPDVSRDLAVFVDTLDENWYGQQPTPVEQYNRCRALFDRIYRFA